MHMFVHSPLQLTEYFNKEKDVLNLSNKLRSFQDVSDLCEYLKFHPEIKELDVSNHSTNQFQFTFESIKKLAGINSIISLNISNCNIRSAGAKILSENTTLKKLNIACNNIDDDGALTFKDNFNLTELNISNNNLTTIGGNALACAFLNNHSLSIIASGNKLNKLLICVLALINLSPRARFYSLREAKLNISALPPITSGQIRQIIQPNNNQHLHSEFPVLSQLIGYIKQLTTSEDLVFNQLNEFIKQLISNDRYQLNDQQLITLVRLCSKYLRKHEDQRENLSNLSYSQCIKILELFGSQDIEDLVWPIRELDHANLLSTSNIEALIIAQTRLMLHETNNRPGYFLDNIYRSPPKRGHVNNLGWILGELKEMCILSQTIFNAIVYFPEHLILRGFFPTLNGLQPELLNDFLKYCRIFSLNFYTFKTKYRNDVLAAISSINTNHSVENIRRTVSLLRVVALSPPITITSHLLFQTKHNMQFNIMQTLPPEILIDIVAKSKSNNSLLTDREAQIIAIRNFCRPAVPPTTIWVPAIHILAIMQNEKIKGDLLTVEEIKNIIEENKKSITENNTINNISSHSSRSNNIK